MSNINTKERIVYISNENNKPKLKLEWALFAFNLTIMSFSFSDKLAYSYLSSWYPYVIVDNRDKHLPFLPLVMSSSFAINSNWF